MDQSKQYLPKGEECLPNGGEIWGEAKRENHGFRGRPSRHWMVISIQANVSGSNLSIFANLCLF